MRFVDVLKLLAVACAAGPALLLGTPAARAQGSDETDEKAAEAPQLEGASITLEVDGMSCPFCAYGLEKRLMKLSAVDSLVIRVSDGLVRIRLKEGETLSDEKLNEAVKRAGFSLREIERTDG
ncbi:MAG: heavy-metal-associated domain-containing protein [Gemmatimonadetes bacterium]|uniref:Heavy-metal-associated domain-containing protein n=1 Tax=Candidatus Kutchimonas denitrificans TaxID=3056748 RepID=A0AAE4Z5Q0_9BACT|nr:heavy-metal-associated domain-containing protein [Gemmatimonadota bacterium]NIR74048.1 heavy-metal-associated domain-containing protein [Candidatus Kutchimonas denitrificans]NIS03037.1 heavy-metal-associated domain-containing protein [Gemmatimonadota bacterium]NIT68754.1 heavy-metal-associated domain-containing protein [Gemmatimonadota bacterium]NIU53335.1 hypothetical protein [Gemmatimonadota bacterium]